MAINERKYENVILYLIANMRDGMIHGKKKLAKLLYVKEIQEYDMYRPTTVYSSDVKPDMSVFDEDDKRILERVIRHYGASSGRDLELRSHGEAPWRAVGERESIPFELAFYRETDFSDAM